MCSKPIRTSGVINGGWTPDFTGIGHAEGQTFDISTALGREPHWLRPYGAGMQVITYPRPANFSLFPPVQEAP